ncbi:MAG: hypothetical protein K2J88_06880 [Oscillospiraceae bacterium]|nr:hypothetical protein [Oscillospiraceae bacterium]
MKKLFISEKWEIIIDKELLSTLSHNLYLYTKLAVEHAGSRNEALALVNNYVAIEDYIKTACCKNNVSYKRYVTGRKETFINFIEKKFPLANEPPESEIITDGQVPF